MKKLNLKSCTVLCLVMSLILATPLGVFGVEPPSDMQQSFQNRIESVQQNKLLSDSNKIGKLIEIYFYLKSENYKQDNDIDVTLLHSSDKQFSKNREYLEKKHAYYKELKRISGGKIIWDNVNIKINDIKIDGDNAIATVNEDYKYVLDNYDHGISSTGFNYTIELKKQDNGWFISSIKSDDEFDRAYFNTDFSFEGMSEEAFSDIAESDNYNSEISEDNSEQLVQDDDGVIIAGALVRILITGQMPDIMQSYTLIIQMILTALLHITAHFMIMQI